MWWCCGKASKDDAGCRYSKHESKDDEDIDESAVDNNDKNKSSKCMCCKQVGHSVTDCPRDPNFRTKYQVYEEEDRMKDLKEIKRMNGDSVN